MKHKSPYQDMTTDKSIVIYTPKCPKCGSSGGILDEFGDGIMLLECNNYKKCNNVWPSQPASCTLCGKPNAYPGDGLCKKCYAQEKSARDALALQAALKRAEEQ